MDLEIEIIYQSDESWRNLPNLFHHYCHSFSTHWTSTIIIPLNVSRYIVSTRLDSLERERLFVSAAYIWLHLISNRPSGCVSLKTLTILIKPTWKTRQIWGIWKLWPAYSPETPKLGQNRWCFVLCDLEIWRRTLENNRASLLCSFKLCATFYSHWWIQTGLTVRKRPIWVKFDDF